MDDPKVQYLPCRCWSADHLIRIDTWHDDPDELNIAIVSGGDCSFRHRLKWAFRHIFNRQDLVFADVIIRRADMLAAVSPPNPTAGG